jgi:hypothetical protein
METSASNTSDQPGGRSPITWVLVTLLILLNVWYDYYHPLGIMFDVVLAVALFVWYLNKSTPAR